MDQKVKATNLITAGGACVCGIGGGEGGWEAGDLIALQWSEAEGPFLSWQERVVRIVRHPPWRW